ncbi:MAG TPA: methylated-DNA--[protein]-cysteine S-methyltransferase [Saprospiraceae bacterium]|nr:methylated-DNA--[protein]-cysteine S-methyltransferase [Saprospiraceae bacterium]HNT19978.1 methylated-DNA--[protein]-cysteine S-methyltransferase [Saprospiraceae bacterium]
MPGEHPYQAYLFSPIGYIYLARSEMGLTHVHLSRKEPGDDFSQGQDDLLLEAKKQLASYFSGSLQRFDLPLDFGKAPEFSQAVWRLLLQIPYGHTRSYGALARDLGDIRKSRAVGHANAVNPMAIIVPCHRVIGSTGALTGYAYGMDAKEFLLALENPNRGKQTELF